VQKVWNRGFLYQQFNAFTIVVYTLHHNDVKFNEGPSKIFKSINRYSPDKKFILIFFILWRLCSYTNNSCRSYCIRGGDLEGDWGDGPQKFEVEGTAHALVPPIFWEVVLWDGRERSNRVKNRCRQGILFLNSAFPCEEKDIYDILHNKDTENLKRVKIRKTWSMTKKKGHQNFWPWKWKFVVPKNVIQKFWSTKIFFRPPKLGARSPPLYCIITHTAYIYIYIYIYIIIYRCTSHGVHHIYWVMD